MGDKVIFIERVGTWQSHIVCDARKVLRIPSQIAPEQAAMLKVNPATAWRVLKGFEQLEPEIGLFKMQLTLELASV
ncbi:hypothetical protein GCM10020366_11450 [Saccharopolyspora gregorii]|uniref:Uncharacterized protein n=1 Tax=Saccharopolyspora gregorii TaxID=33914 RepID=A0ABP6RIS9_9PSEU